MNPVIIRIEFDNYNIQNYNNIVTMAQNRTEADELSEINRKHREKILSLKNRTQNMFNRPPPMTFQRTQNYQMPKKTSVQTKTNTFDFLKQYQSGKTSQEHDISAISKDKQFDYNSTLFRNIKQQSHIAEKPSEFINGSSISAMSSNSQPMDLSQNFKDSNLLNKIDQLLKVGKAQQSKGGIKNVYDEYFMKKSHLSSSSAFSNNSSSNPSEFKMGESQLKNKTHAHLISNKLKTIQEQKRTIEKEQKQMKQKQTKRKIENKEILAKKPPLPSNNTIERQKRKIQQTMMELKQQKDTYEFHDKSSILLELSDNDSEIEQKQIAKTQKQEKATKKEKSLQLQQKQKGNENSKEIEKALIQQKQNLLRQLEIIQRELEQLQLQQSEDD